MATRIYILHGWAVDPDNEGKWEHFRNELNKDKIQSTFVPLPGLSTPLDEAWDLNDYVEYVKHEIEKNHSGKLYKVVLLGHSFGGQVAVRLAAKYPQLIDKLILVDSSGLRPMDLISRIKRAIFYYAAKMGKRFTSSKILKSALYKLAREQDYVTADENLKKTMSNVISYDISSDLKSVSHPTLIIWGAEDNTTPVKLAHKIKSYLPKADLVFIDGAKHSPQFTHFKQTANEVVKFLGKAK